MATNVRFSSDQIKIVSGRVESAQDKEAARTALVKMAVSLTNGQTVKSGYLRMIRDGDGLKLGTSLFGDRAEKEKARDLVRSLVRNAYGHHAGVEAEIDRYLAFRDQKIGTQSFVRLIKTLDGMEGKPAGPTEENQRLAAAAPKQNANLRGERVESSVQLSRAVASVRLEVQKASAELALPEGAADPSLSVQVGAARSEHERLAAQPDHSLLKTPAVQNELASLREQADKLERLGALLQQKQDLPVRLGSIGRAAKADKTLPQSKVDDLRVRLDQAKETHEQLGTGMRQALSEDAAIAGQTSLQDQFKELTVLLDGHAAQRKTINSLIAEKNYGEAADLLITLDPALGPTAAQERLLPSRAEPGTGAKICEHLAHARLQRGHWRPDARHCFGL
jgi:hypothetical protein